MSFGRFQVFASCPVSIHPKLNIFCKHSMWHVSALRSHTIAVGIGGRHCNSVKATVERELVLRRSQLQVPPFVHPYELTMYIEMHPLIQQEFDPPSVDYLSEGFGSRNMWSTETFPCTKVATPAVGLLFSGHGGESRCSILWWSSIFHLLNF